MPPAPRVHPRLTSVGLALACLTLLGLCALPSPARAGDFAVMLSGEVWADDEVPFHGIAILAYDFDPIFAGARPSVVLNTDTLRLGLDELRLADDWRLGFSLVGEYAIAGLLTDYRVDGQAVPERGFQASYVEAEARIKRLVAGGGWAELSLRGRRWIFSRTDDTDPGLELPPEAWVFMPRLYLGWWRLAGDAGWAHRHRLFPRLAGWAVGIEAGADVRSASEQWGAIGAGFEDPDPRNRPASVIPLVRQWALFGVPLGRLRLEIEQRAGFGLDEDDLTRERIGGLNPYVVRVPGAPWASWLSERFVGGRVALPVRLFADVEAGPTAAAVWLRDPLREGSDEMGAVWGAGLSLDARFGRWQVDARGGVSPTLTAERDEGVAWSAYLGVGWGTGG